MLPCRYILANIEHNRGVKKGDAVWQLSFGGGEKAPFACSHAVTSMAFRMLYQSTADVWVLCAVRC